MSGPVWTEDRTEILTRMWKAGSSASEIGLKLGCTRNAALGKLHRLGLTKTRSQDVARFNIRRLTPRDVPRTPRRTKPRNVNVGSLAPNIIRRAEERAAEKTRPKPQPAELRTFPNAKPWTERTFGQCAFPIGSGADTQSCSSPTAEKRNYCPDCEAVMFAPSLVNARLKKSAERFSQFMSRAA